MIYKSMKREYAEALVSKGQLRIGTLYDFRKEELYGSEIGDKSKDEKGVRLCFLILDSGRRQSLGTEEELAMESPF